MSCIQKARRHPVRQWARRAVLAGLLATAGLSQARELSFGEALEAARVHDAQYRAAGYEYDATRQGVPIAGEAGVGGSAAAVVNAVNDALAPLNVSITDLPLTAPRVWQAIQSAAQPARKREVA